MEESSESEEEGAVASGMSTGQPGEMPPSESSEEESSGSEAEVSLFMDREV